MKKLLTYWGDIAFAPFYLVLLFAPFSYDDTIAFILRIFSVVFLIAAIVLLIWNPMKKQRALRDWTYLIYGVFAALFLVGTYANALSLGPAIEYEGTFAREAFLQFKSGTFVFLRFFVETLIIVRIGIWSYKLFQRRKAKKTPSEEA